MEDTQKKVTEVFNSLQFPLNQAFLVCDGIGADPICKARNLFALQEQYICFNGDSKFELNEDTFCLTQKRKCKGERYLESCTTERKPYDFLVVAILILANYYCPNCYQIASDGSKSDWLPVKEWLKVHLLKDYPLPKKIN